MLHLRRLSRLGLAACVALSLVAALAPAVTSAASGTTRWVDSDGKAGPSGCGGNATAFKHIQKAVNQSGPGDTVLVCPGTYRGMVEISGDRAGLTLRGVDPWKAVLVPPLGLYTAGFGALTMIAIDGVDDVTVHHLKIAAQNEPGCTPVAAAIAVNGSRRAKILSNQIFASPNPSGCGYGIGIVVSDSLPMTSTAGATPVSASALIAHNLVANFQEAGIAAGEENVQVTITDNSLHYYLTQHPVMQTTASANLRAFGLSAMRASSSFRPAGTLGETTGILIEGSVKALIDLNVVQSAADAELAPLGLGPIPQLLPFGIQVIEDEAPVIVRDNLVRRVQTGMYIQAIGATVQDNVVRKTQTGLAIGFGGGGSRVRRNVFDGFEDGIYVDSSTGENVFRANTAFSASGLACEDTTPGPGGTAGTSNLWVNNTGNSDNPDGICPELP